MKLFIRTKFLAAPRYTRAARPQPTSTATKMSAPVAARSGSTATGRTTTMIGIRTNRATATRIVANNRRPGRGARRIFTTTTGDIDCLSRGPSPSTISVINANRMLGRCSSQIL